MQEAGVNSQLDPLAHRLLKAAVESSSIAAVARQLGYKRPSVSMALAGKYPGDARHLRAAIIETLQGRHGCPALSREVSQPECRDFRARPIPTSPRSAVARWEACQRCGYHPKNGGVHG